MNSFLFDTAQDIVKKHKNNGDFCLVFPNKRSLYFFDKEYVKLVGKTTWALNRFTIDSVINSWSDYQKCDTLSLLFCLYDSFSEIFGKKNMLNSFLAEDFDKFYETGLRILNDFNEIDNYLVNIKQLCTNIADLAGIDAEFTDFSPEQIEAIKSFWANFSTEKLSNEKLRFKELWENLPNVYDIFYQKLKKKGIAYGGMINRNVCHKLDRGEDIKFRFKTYIFIGFNALNKAEKQIFKRLRNGRRAEFYWDCDDYYVNNPIQEAGLFLRGNLPEFPNQLPLQNSKLILKNPKTIEFIGVPLQVGQAKAVFDILRDFKEQGENISEKTAIVLADEHLLFPVLHSIPQEVEKINVTMGYPFSETPVYSFIINCLAIRNNIRKTQDVLTYYYKDVLAVINHPLICNMPDFYCKTFIKTINENKMVRVSGVMFETEQLILDRIFNYQKYETSPSVILENFMEIISALFFKKNPGREPKGTVENEYLYNAYIAIKQIFNQIKSSESRYKFSNELVINLLRQVLVSISVPFDAEAGAGVQIIGMIETRNIDFENLIIIGMNEDVFPHHSDSDSFITENMRFAFDMPVIRYKDAVFSYFFYRLLQRAKNVKILYNNVFGGNQSGEMSRFAAQVNKELDKKFNKDSQVNIVRKTFARDISPVENFNIEIVNNSDTINKLRRYLASSENPQPLSPSALNAFFACRLKFYFRYVAKLKEETILSEEADTAIIGNILHKSIENIYKKITSKTGGVITLEQLETINNVEKYIYDAFAEEYNIPVGKKFELSGTNKIIFDVIKEYVKNIIDFDKKICPFKLKSLERAYRMSFDIMVEGKPEKVLAGGYPDRIDINNNGLLRIVDYKTGSINKKMDFGGIDELFDFEKKHNDIAFQLLLYSTIYAKLFGKQAIPAVYSVREIAKDNSFDPYLKLKIEKSISIIDKNNIENLTQDFSVKLREMLQLLYNPDTIFYPTKDNNNCKYCGYSKICNAK